ncbi:DUF3750 domain-containing protein [Bdellovibrio sp. SKB1291214]|uniref:DUF3750 domain-containing protein n=1 Tax=Bdellovibrio sp. SKB1291214 TaxID=1732569 RepID=UPI000B679562|nr:DUF3750 domain-containing protein [Bdellovibrio sp. SKB1291214]UYL09297.1 DUF3750 domain-containing protein [Bdellovibrio sp. SKB1291214]
MKMKSALIMGVLFFKSLLVEANDWRTADRSSIGIAPTPQEDPRAIVQIYSARTYGFKGNLAVHSWIAYKEKHGAEWNVYEVIGYYADRGFPVIRQTHRQPDQRWFGNEPSLHMDVRGEAAEKMIPDLIKAIESYPYPHSYRIYPGPNSNTFVSYVMRNTPGIYTDLPPHAIGKDWIGKGQPVGITESGTGVQFSLFGLLGASIGLAEGIELNLLGMSFGIDFARPALKLPFVGRLGMSDKPVFNTTEPSAPLSSHSPPASNN